MSYRYDAFISYRHVEPDRKWARWLHRALETFRTPRALVAKGHPERIARVFRDEEELAASSDLSGAIEEALAQSNFLIVVCSPRTPASKWVNEEVVRFREFGRDGRVLALLIEGEPSEAFPGSLCEIRRTLTDAGGHEYESIEEVEPLAADVRPAHDASPRDMRRMALLRCAAALIGCRFDDLRQRDHQRRQRRLMATSVAAVALAAVLAGLALFAFAQRGIAQDRALQAQRRLAQSLLTQGDAQAASDAYRSARASYIEARAVQSSLNSSTLSAELGLWDSLRRSPPPLVLLPLEQVATDAVFLSGDRVLVASVEGLDLWNARRRVLVRHVVQDEVESLAVSRDETRIVTGGRRSQVATVRELESGQELARFEVGQPVLDVAFSADGKRVLTGGQHGLATIWEVATGKQLASVSHFPALAAVAWLPDGRVLTAGVPTRAANVAAESADIDAVFAEVNKAADALTEEALQRLAAGEDLVDFAPRIELHRLLIWDMASGVATLGLPGKGNANDVAITPDGRLALVAVDEQVELWDLRRGELLFAAQAGQDTTGVAISPDGARALSVGNAGRLVAWDLPGRRRSRTIDVDDVGHRGVSFDASGRLALLNGAGPLAVVDLEQTPEARRFGSDPVSIQDVAFSPDGRLAVSATDQRILVVWDVDSGRELGTLDGHDDTVSRVAFLPDSRRIVTAGLDGMVRLWDLDQGAEIQAFTAKTALGRVEALAVSPSGRRVLTGHWNHQVVLWDVDEARELRALEGYTVDPWSLAFIGEDRAAVGYPDGSVGVWDLTTGREERPLFGGHWPYAVAAWPDGRVLAGDSNDQVWYWDANSGELLGRLKGHEDTVRAVAFLSSQRAVTVAEDRRLIVWDLEQQVPVRQLELDPDEYDGRITLGLAPGPRFLVGNTDAGRDFVHVWEIGRAMQTSNRPTGPSGLAAWYAERGHWTWASRSLDEAEQPDPGLRTRIEAGLEEPQGLTDGPGDEGEQSAALLSSLGYVMRLMEVVDRGRTASPAEFLADANERLEAGNASDALPYFERALRTSTDWLRSPERWEGDLTEYLATQRREAMFGRSRAYVILEDYPRALTDARMLVDEVPQDVRYRLQLARVHEGLGGMDLARRQLDEALDLAPNDSATHIAIADFHERQGDVDAAVSALDRLVELEPSAINYANRAALKERLGRVEGAIADVTKALALEESAVHYAWRARLHTTALALPEALADWDRVEMLEPDMLWLRYYQAELRMNLGDLDGAEADLDSASEAERDHPASLGLRGRLLLFRNDWPGAEALFSRVLEASPDQTTSYFHRADARQRQGNIAGALADLGRAIELAGDEAEIYIFRGYIYLTEGDHERALMDFDQSIRLAPGHALAHHNRGVALRELGRLGEALTALNRALELDSETPRTYYQRGLTLRALGQHTEARADLKTYLRLAPDASERDEIASYLSQTD